MVTHIPFCLPPKSWLYPVPSKAILLVAYYGGQYSFLCIGLCCLCPWDKSPNRPPAGLLHPLPVPSRPWSHVALDFVTGLPPSNGITVILTIVDRFSKSALCRDTLHCVAAKNPSSWSTHLVWVEYAHNCLSCAATGLSPFEGGLGLSTSS